MKEYSNDHIKLNVNLNIHKIILSTGIVLAIGLFMGRRYSMKDKQSGIREGKIQERNTKVVDIC